jgi:hypothetical protein
MMEIDRHALFPAIGPFEKQVAVTECEINIFVVIHLTEGVSGPGLLDLDYLSSQIAQYGRSPWTGVKDAPFQ